MLSPVTTLSITKLHSCSPDKDLARSSHYTLLQDIVHIVGTRVPSVTAISVLYVIYWRIESYAHTVFIVLEADSDPKVLWPGFDLPCRPEQVTFTVRIAVLVILKHSTVISR